VGAEHQSWPVATTGSPSEPLILLVASDVAPWIERYSDPRGLATQHVGVIAVVNRKMLSQARADRLPPGTNVRVSCGVHRASS
jgi:hypothetical protein